MLGNDRPLIGNAVRSGDHWSPEEGSGSGTGGHVGGQDVVGVAVEVLAGPVVAHGGAWVGVAGGDLDVAQVHASVEHGGDEGMAEHVRVGLVIRTPAASARRRRRRWRRGGSSGHRGC